MKKEHQKLLWESCNAKDLDYFDMLALIWVESNFDEKCTSSNGTYRGYFQMSKGNCANMAKTLGTANKPLDGAISIKWGTTFYSWILQDERVKKVADDKKRDVALSLYQRGPIGYDKYGLSTAYLKAFYNRRARVEAIFAED
jgi:membrane-bound lytic murein transglycosylase MltF